MVRQLNIFKKSQETRGAVLLSSIVIGMILVSVISSIFLMISNSTRSQTYQKAVIEFNIMLRSIRTQISNPQICSRTLLRDHPFDQSTLRHNVRLANLTLGGQNTPFMVGEIVFDKLRLVSVEIVRESSAQNLGFPIQVDANRPERLNYAGHLVITVEDQYGKRMSNTRHMRMTFEQIPIYFNVEDGRIIRSCYGDKSVAHYCERLGGAWNEQESRGPEYRCNPNVKCYTRNLLAPDQCHPPYTSVQIGATTSPIFICQWCNSYVKARSR